MRVGVGMCLFVCLSVCVRGGVYWFCANKIFFSCPKLLFIKYTPTPEKINLCIALNSQLTMTRSSSQQNTTQIRSTKKNSNVEMFCLKQIETKKYITSTVFGISIDWLGSGGAINTYIILQCPSCSSQYNENRNCCITVLPSTRVFVYQPQPEAIKMDRWRIKPTLYHIFLFLQPCWLISNEMCVSIWWGSLIATCSLPCGS